MTDIGEEAGRLTVAGIEIEVLRRGEGHPIVLLHGFQTLDPEARVLDLLARHGAVLAPSLPGFGHSPRPEDFDTVADLVHFVLALLDDVPGGKATLIGLSFGGWLAAEAAVKCVHKIARLVLADPVGIKIGPPDQPDILDIFNRLPEEVREKSWHDPDRFAPDFDEMSDEALIVYARNREALCRYAWHPYMYDPQLKRWLARIRVPTLLLWGASDRVVTPDYGRAYSTLIPGSRFELIDGAGHHPEIEQPEAFAAHIAAFLRQ
ncbi:MAG TPA: alpha/beta fold hydrolase [Stellaceae bacterium]|jgi:pimeloyl-ACP methyl ester carboxylesterase|nr:alpha/beta fold hydrolase [Stellaceae bacterium]